MPKGKGWRIDGVVRKTLHPLSTTLRGGCMGRLYGCTAALGDEIMADLQRAGVDEEARLSWASRYTNLLNLCLTGRISFHRGGLALLKMFSEAGELCRAARMVNHGS